MDRLIQRIPRGVLIALAGVALCLLAGAFYLTVPNSSTEEAVRLKPYQFQLADPPEPVYIDSDETFACLIQEGKFDKTGTRVSFMELRVRWLDGTHTLISRDNQIFDLEGELDQVLGNQPLHWTPLKSGITISGTTIEFSGFAAGGRPIAGNASAIACSVSNPSLVSVNPIA